ncbi:diacylglycerol kinase family lipid kinase [Kineococcus sp. NUM-3379]
MSEQFDRVVIVFNPNSTGDGPGNARELAEQIPARLPGVPVELAETQHAGHALELAEQAVAAHPQTLVVSASGDGGYHEVVNGVMRARRAAPGAGVTAVLASGNANDHANAVQDRPLVDAIAERAVSPMDLLEVRVAGAETRWAHSYMGLGITPVAAAELNQHDLDAVKETLLVVRSFWQYRPLSIIHDGDRIKLDSLVFANIDRMGKYATLSDEGSPTDGTYETLLIRHRNKLKLLASFLRVLSGKHEFVSRTEPYAFTTKTPMPLQMDGEVHEIEAGAQVTVRCARRALDVVR